MRHQRILWLVNLSFELSFAPVDQRAVEIDPSLRNPGTIRAIGIVYAVIARKLSDFLFRV